MNYGGLKAPVTIGKPSRAESVDHVICDRSNRSEGTKPVHINMPRPIIKCAKCGSHDIAIPERNAVKEVDGLHATSGT